MRIGFAVLVCLLLCSTQLSAQEKFRSGYVITQQQDTLYGLIDYKSTKRSALICKFRKDENSPLSTYSPEELSGYRFDGGKYYISRTVAVEGETKTVFMEYLLDGIADVFFLRDQAGDHYFFAKEDGALEPLLIEEIETRRDGKPYIWKRESYKGKLKVAFGDAPSLFEEIDGMSLTHSKLIEVAEAYHEEVCDEYACIVYSRNDTPVNIKGGILVASRFSNISFSYVDYLKSYIEDDFPVSQHFSLGGFIQLSDPFVSERLSLQAEAWLGRVTYQTEYLQLTNSYLHTPLMLRYTAIHGKTRPTFAFGPAVDFLLDVKTSQEVGKQEMGWLQGKRLHYGLEAAAGITHKLTSKSNLLIEARYGFRRGRHINAYFVQPPSGWVGPDIMVHDGFNTNMGIFSLVAGFTF